MSRLIVFGLLIVTLSACGQSTEGTAGVPLFPTAVPVAAGQPMTDGKHHTVTLLQAQRGSSTRPGQQCVQVSVSLSNRDGSRWLSPLNGMRLSDARGFVDYPSDDCGTATSLASLDPGQSATAVLYFEILADSRVDFNWAPKIGDQGFSTPLR